MEQIGFLKHLKGWGIITPELDELVIRVQRETGYIFSPNEVNIVLAYTRRKCELNGEGESYVPVLFEDELKNYVMRECVNYAGGINYKGCITAAV